MSNEESRKQKIAVLGGGTGALAAVFGVTEDPNWRSKYEITVYQLGWRLGGKGASGRRQDHEDRIEEHGLHVWAGFYENAFLLMRKCYQELGRSPDSPLATVWDAFKPHSHVTFAEHIDGEWKAWNVDVPSNDSRPGEATELPSVWDYVVDLIEHTDKLFRASEHADAKVPKEVVRHHNRHAPHWLAKLESELDQAASIGSKAVHGIMAHLRADLVEPAQGEMHELLRRILKLVRAMPKEVGEHTAAHHHALLWLTKLFRKALHFILDEFASIKDDVRRLLIMVDFALTTFIGILTDGVLLHGFFSIDDREWTEWLQSHGASELLLNSPLIRGTYDYVFGYDKGKIESPNIGAGTCTHGLLRLTMTYKGAVFYEMQAGMGDTVFAPIYEVLKRRGVNFKFFQEVKSLKVSSDGNSIESIEMAQQVRLKNEEAGYDPLFKVRDLPCWPSEPLYRQIVHGEEIKHRGIDLESAWTDWTPAHTYELQKGDDFDKVILGISIGAFPYITKELMDANESWRSMVENVKTVQTQAMQMWLKPDTHELGREGPPTILTAYANPMNTWADMSYLIKRENWENDTPKSIAYFCGPLPDPEHTPPFSDHHYPKRVKQEVKETCLKWIDQNTQFLWPKSATSQGFRWDAIADPKGGQGEQRFDSQYWRGNASPTERYVLSLKGTTHFRLKSGESGFENLYLAGDWTWTAINAGCIEAAVMSGFQASQAINGFPKDTIGSLT